MLLLLEDMVVVAVVAEKSVVLEVEAGVVDAASVVGKKFANHSIVPPCAVGRRATSSRTFGAENATVIVSDAEGHVHSSPLRIVFGFASSSHAILDVQC